jgi:hypothetical protein
MLQKPGKQSIHSITNRRSNKNDERPVISLVDQQDNKEDFRNKSKTKTTEKTTTTILQNEESRSENKLHTQTQFNLIQLGKMCGCTVYIAKGDRNKSINGKIICFSRHKE